MRTRKRNPPFTPSTSRRTLSMCVASWSLELYLPTWPSLWYRNSRQPMWRSWLSCGRDPVSFVSLPNTSSYEAMSVFVGIIGILCGTKGVLVVKSAVYPDLDRNSKWQRGLRLCWEDREEGADGGGAKSSAHSLLEWSPAIICYNFPKFPPKNVRFRQLIPQGGRPIRRLVPTNSTKRPTNSKAHGNKFQNFLPTASFSDPLL